MRKLVILAIIAIVSSCAVSKRENENSLFWQISGSGLEQPSYLFGTIHLMCPDDIQITEGMEIALKNSQRLVLELDFDEPGAIKAMQQAAIMTDGTTLNDLLSKEEYQLVRKYLQDSLSIPIQVVNTMKPMMLSMLMYMDVLNCQPGSYEMALTQRAEALNIEVMGLETIEDQVRAFDFLPLEEQADYLVEAIKHYDKTVAEIESMLKAYQMGQVNRLYALTHKSMQEMVEAEAILLNDRNQKWIPVIEKLVQEHATFFAVGAGHLGGPHGIIALLREQGYTLEVTN